MNTPRVTIKYRPDEPVYIEVWNGDSLLVAGWVHEEPWPCYIEEEEEEEEEGYFIEDENPWEPIHLPAEEIIDPPLHDGGGVVIKEGEDSE